MKTLNIKNMVCDRCILVVRQEIEKLNLAIQQISLGHVTIAEVPTSNQMQVLEKELLSHGFELIEDKNKQIISRIKAIIVDIVHHQKETQKVNLSVYISQQLLQDYNSLSTLFSSHEGITIEKYYIAQKIERVKELIIYNQLSLSEIAELLHYSSVAYLSNQFKKVTGLSPSQYKNQQILERKPLDKV